MNNSKNKNKYVGSKIGRLLVLEKSTVKRGGNYKYLCRCDCGTEKLISGGDLSTNTRSCGCLRKERITNLNKLNPGEAALNGLINNYRQRAKIAGLEYSLSKEEFQQIITKPCVYCESLPGNHKFTSNNGDLPYNGLDRINNELGYISTNVTPCCAECNWMKRTMSLDTFFKKISKIYQVFNKGNHDEN